MVFGFSSAFKLPLVQSRKDGWLQTGSLFPCGETEVRTMRGNYKPGVVGTVVSKKFLIKSAIWSLLPQEKSKVIQH